MAFTKTKKIGKYEILDVVGRGGMGVVYKAVDPSIGRLVAIKMITGNFAEDADYLKRFYREAKSTGMLQHQNIVIVHDLGDFNGTPFLVMEFLEGESLDSVIKQKRTVPLLEKLNLTIQVCNGLHYAHERNVVHRDIKPANLMVLKGGLLKIVDFGIARIEDQSNFTMQTQVVGTLPYMSPEQINGEHPDGRTDIYSTGVVLYQFLTSHLPYDGPDTGSVLLRKFNEPPPPLSKYLENYPAELDAILQRAMAKARDDRYQTAEEFAFDLMQVQEQLKREASAEYFRAAEDALARGELSKAREQCLEIMRFDRQDTRAKQLLQQVQQRIQKQQRSEQARQLRAQAQEAFTADELERALQYICQAVEVDPDNSELLAFRETIREAKLRADQHREAFKRAQSAHYAGDLTEALEAVEKALALDASDTDAQALRAEVTHEIEQRKRQAAIQGFVEEAQRQISSRRFTAALEALQQAEALDPTAPGVRELMTLAATGREQELRRKELERLTTAVTDALNQDDYAAACQRCDEALKQFPEDRGLLKLKAMAERRLQVAEKRKFIEEQVASARRLLEQKQTETALRDLQAACARFPNEPALLSVLTIVQQTLQHEKEEARKDEYIQRAREALRGKRFAEAIEVLEAGCAEFNSPELEDLLQFAHEEAASFALQQRVEAAAEEARRLMSAEEHEKAITFLRATLAEVADEDLSILLAEAERHVEDFNRRVNECVETAERLLRVDRVTEAVRYLDSQAAAFEKSPRFREIAARARECQERLRQIAAAVEKARAALAAQEWASAEEHIEQCRRTYGDHPELARVASQITADRAEAAASTLTKATNDCRMLFLARSYENALQLLDRVADMLEFAPEDLRLRYLALHEEAERGVARKQQEAENARAKSDLSTKIDDTKERTSWKLHPSTRETTDSQTLLQRDLQELQQLAHEAETTVGLHELSSVSARARVLAARHGQDAPFQTAVEEVVTTATRRAESLTSMTQLRRPGSSPRREEPPATGDETFLARPLSPMPPPAVEGAELHASQASEAATVEPAAPVSEPVVSAEASASASASQAAAAPAAEDAGSQTRPELQVLPAAPPADVPDVEHGSMTLERPIPLRPEELPPELAAWGERLAAGAENARVVMPRAPAPAPRSSAPPAPLAPPREGPPRLLQMEPRRAAPAPVPPRFKIRNPRWIALIAAVLVAVVLLVWKLWPSAPAGRTPEPAKPVMVVSSTPAGAVVQVQDETCVTPNCRLQLAPGDYEIKASLAGYKPEARIVHVAASAAPPTVSLTLAPLPTTVRINTNLGNGTVLLDGKSVGSLRQGQFEVPNVAQGQHTLKVSGEKLGASAAPEDAGASERPALESAELTFSAATARAPEIQGSFAAQGVSALAVSIFTDRTRIQCNCDAGAKIIIDGREAGQVKSGRLDVESLREGSHQLQIGAGQDSAIHIVPVTAAPALELFLEGQRKVGVLVVQTGVVDAAVYLDGRKAGMTGSDGVFRSTLPVKPVAVRVAKPGYRTAPPQTAQLRSSGETGLTFNLVADEAKLVAGGQPNTSVALDGQELGAIDSRGEFSAAVPPGNHTVEFSRKGFEPQRVNLSFTAGDTTRLTADLVPLPKKAQAEVPAPMRATPPVMQPQPPALPPTSPQTTEPAAPSPDQADWQRTQDTKDPAVLEAFLSRYPTSPRAGDARDRLRQLQLADRNGVLATLKRYADAYQHKSADEVEAVWPSLGKEARKKISDSFKSAQSIHADLRPSGDPTFSGDSATVTCDRNLLFTFSGGEQQNVNDRVVIRLRKKSGSWLIESVS